MKKLSLVLAGLSLVALFFAVRVEATKPAKVTVCHAAGRAGTTKYVELHLPWVAVYGKAGHLNENGTTQAGHEQDYLGECRVNPTGTPTPQLTTVVTTTPTNTTTPSVTVTPVLSATVSPQPTASVSPQPTASPTPTEVRTFVVPQGAPETGYGTMGGE